MRPNGLAATRPWHVGLLVYLVLVLSSSLLAAPWVAAGIEFGHWHPDGEPAHIHAITGILAGAVTAALVAVTVSCLRVSALTPRPLQAFAESVLDPALAIRAPPTASLAAAAPY